jgi:hypothetical protein
MWWSSRLEGELFTQDIARVLCPSTSLSLSPEFLLLLSVRLRPGCLVERNLCTFLPLHRSEIQNTYVSILYDDLLSVKVERFFDSFPGVRTANVLQKPALVGACSCTSNSPTANKPTRLNGGENKKSCSRGAGKKAHQRHGTSVYHLPELAERQHQ